MESLVNCEPFIVPGSPEWHKWRHEVQHVKRHNKPAIDHTHPLHPKHHPLPSHLKVEVAKAHNEHLKMVAYAHKSLSFEGKMVYSEAADRSEMYQHATAGQFEGHHADCSQFGATISGKWVNCQGWSVWSYTGTIVETFRQVGHFFPGCGIVWGPGTGAHFAFGSDIEGSVHYCVGFGSQQAPNRNTMDGMEQYFNAIGEAGVRFYDLTQLKIKK